MAPMKMFITDLDGTLFRSDRRACDKALARLDHLGRMGVIRVLATGRSLFSLQRSLASPLPVDYLIFSTGLGVAKYPEPQGRTLKTDGFTVSDTRFIVSVLDQLELDFMLQHAMPDNHVFSYRHAGHAGPDFLTRLNYYQGYHRPLDSRRADLPPASQFIVILPDVSPAAIIDDLRRRLSMYSIITCASPFDGKSLWIEIFPRSVSKGRAADWLARRLGILPRDAAAVGNDFNDEDLLTWAGRAFVTANSPAALKERFQVVASNDGGGVYEAIEALLTA
ncbi:Cof-type HAD-IIB family hydrolase [Desulfatiferula olefinivorans]